MSSASPSGVLSGALDGLYALARWTVGPIFGKELRVSSRKLRNFVLRSVYVALMLLVVLLVWATTIQPQMSRSTSHWISRMSEVGKYVVTTIVWFQLIALQLVSVIMLSTGISGEIQARTLGVLMTTPISASQIVIGKLLSKLLQLIILLAISLPLLALVRVFGGVPWDYVLSGVCITFTACLFAGSVALLFSILFRRAYAAILVSLAVGFVLYAVAPGVVGMLMALTYMGRMGSAVARGTIESVMTVICHGNPFAVEGMATAEMWQPGAGGLSFFWWLHCLIMLGLSAAVIFLCIVLVRRVALRQACGGDFASSAPSPAPPPALAPAGPADLPVVQPVAQAGAAYAETGTIRRITGSPVLWRELRTPMTRSLVMKVIGIVVPLSIAAVVYALIGYLDGLDEENTQVGFVCLYTVIGLLVTMVLAATSITSEKESQSWPLLLSTTLSDGQILWGKFAGVARRCWPGWALLVAHLLAFVVCGVLHAVVLVHLVMIVAYSFVFLTGAGLFFSAVFRKSTAAVVTNMGLAAVLWVLGPILLGIGTGGGDVFELSLSCNPVVQAGVVTAGACGFDYGSAYGVGWVLKYDWPGPGGGGDWDLLETTVLETTALLVATATGYCLAGLALAWGAQRLFRRKIF